MHFVKQKELHIKVTITFLISLTAITFQGDENHKQFNNLIVNRINKPLDLICAFMIKRINEHPKAG